MPAMPAMPALPGKRTHRWSIRVADAEATAIARGAARLGLTVTEFLRLGAACAVTLAEAEARRAPKARSAAVLARVRARMLYLSRTVDSYVKP